MNLENIKTAVGSDQPYIRVGAGLRTFERQDGAQKDPLKSPNGVRLGERPQHLAVTRLGAHDPGRQLAFLRNARTSQVAF